MGTVGIVIAAFVGALAGLTVSSAADRIATARYGPGAPGHDPDDLALALIPAPTSARAGTIAAVVTTVAITLLAGEFADVEVWLFFSVLTWAYAVAAVIDLQYLRLPDVITKPAAAFAVAGSVALAARFDHVEAAWPGIVAALGVYALLWVTSRLYELVRQRGEAFGLGDMKLLLSTGPSVGWLGWTAGAEVTGPIAIVIWALLAGMVLGSVSGLVLRGFKPSMGVPFGPFLMAGWLIVVLLADTLRP